jgi:hypothetical protein
MNTHDRSENGLGVGEVIRQLRESTNVCDQRKGHDLEEVVTLTRTAWADRLTVCGFLKGARRSLLAVCSLTGTKGLVWEGAPAVADRFRFVAGMNPDYPLSLPFFKFLTPAIPWNPHCVHPAFVPGDTAGLPAEMQAYLREGQGNLCYIQWHQWNAKNDSLAVAIWDMSRILSGRFHAEAASLNHAARDYMLRGECGVELGPPLPYPRFSAAAAAAAGEEEGGGEAGGKAVAWLGEEAERCDA